MSTYDALNSSSKIALLFVMLCFFTAIYAVAVGQEELTFKGRTDEEIFHLGAEGGVCESVVKLGKLMETLHKKELIKENAINAADFYIELVKEARGFANWDGLFRYCDEIKKDIASLHKYGGW